MGIFTRTPVAKQLGQHASMADGLFDHLPVFPYASTSEILDIRTELSPELGAFRASALLPGSLGIAAGPTQAFIAAASVVTGTTIAAVKSLIKESDAKRRP